MTPKSEAEPQKEDQASRDEIELTAHCLCKAQHFTALVARSSLPLEATYCHCTSCRRVTGSLYSTYVPWPGSAPPISKSESLRRYTFSEAITLFSCGICSSNMFAETRGEGGVARYGVQMGVLANVDVGDADAGLVRITNHIFVDDTRDGGAVPWLCDVNRDGSRPRLWGGARERSEEVSSSLESILRRWPSIPAGGGSGADVDSGALPDEIPIRCHCGGVDLVLRCPIADFAARKERNTKGDAGGEEEEKESLPWFVDPISKKSRANFDACDSCRLWSGTDIYYWTFALLKYLAFPAPASGGRRPSDFPQSSLALKAAVSVSVSPTDSEGNGEGGQRAPRDPRLGTLTYYPSSPDVQRYSCSVCSASVFYASDDRPDMVDVAIGLLNLDTDSSNTQGGNGARAEDLLTWDYGSKIGWRQDAAGGWREGFIESIEAAAERWRVGRGYPKSWRRVQMEKEAEEPAAASASGDVA